MRVAIYLDGLFSGVADDVAVVAPLEVIFQLRLRLRIDGVVEIICQFLQKIAAGHLVPSPLFRDLKYLLSLSRNCRRARKRRDLTAGILRSSASAVSSVERPSTSRNTNTVLKPAGRPWMVFPRMSF